jgi:hypothetical protein
MLLFSLAQCALHLAMRCPWRVAQGWELLFEGPALGPASAVAAEASGVDPWQLFRETRLSWRGDGKFLAVVARDPAAQPPAAAPDGLEPAAARAPLPPFRVRVWDRHTLEMHAAGEASEGLQPLPAWQPNGRHLYVAADAKPAVVSAGAPSPASACVAVSAGCVLVSLQIQGSAAVKA